MLRGGSEVKAGAQVKGITLCGFNVKYTLLRAAAVPRPENSRVHAGSTEQESMRAKRGLSERRD